MTQLQIDQLNQQEYCHMLAYGDPKRTEDIASIPFDAYNTDHPSNMDLDDWICTLDSTTCAGMTFGYTVEPCISTAV